MFYQTKLPQLGNTGALWIFIFNHFFGVAERLSR